MRVRLRVKVEQYEAIKMRCRMLVCARGQVRQDGDSVEANDELLFQFEGVRRGWSFGEPGWQSGSGCIGGRVGVGRVVGTQCSLRVQGEMLQCSSATISTHADCAFSRYREVNAATRQKMSWKPIVRTRVNVRACVFAYVGCLGVMGFTADAWLIYGVFVLFWFYSYLPRPRLIGYMLPRSARSGSCKIFAKCNDLGVHLPPDKLGLPAALMVAGYHTSSTAAVPVCDCFCHSMLCIAHMSDYVGDAIVGETHAQAD